MKGALPSCHCERSVAISPAKSEMQISEQFCHLDLGFYLSFELCHLALRGSPLEGRGARPARRTNSLAGGGAMKGTLPFCHCEPLSSCHCERSVAISLAPNSDSYLLVF